jgi:hypothetical protein
VSFKLFHIFIVEEIKESLVEDSLQKGKIISFPFLKEYTDVLCMVGAINMGITICETEERDT